MVRIMPTVLRACMYAAVEEGRLTGNPAARVGKFVGRTRVEVDIFTREELTRLLVTAAQEMPIAYPPVLTLARTGLRIEDALTLQPHDLDFDRRELWVRRYGNPHTPRHTIAAMLIQPGESLAYVKEQLGHSSVTITVDTYGHRIAGTNKAAVDRLDDATRRNPRATGVAGTLRIVKGERV